MTTPRSIASHAYAALARRLDPAEGDGPEVRFLRSRGGESEAADAGWRARLGESVASPLPEDRALVRVAEALGLTAIEVLAVALAAAVEEDPLAARAVAYMQAPAGGLRPTLGLCAVAFAGAAPDGVEPLHALATGAALRGGLLVRGGDAPLAEQALTVPLPLYLALRGHDPAVPGLTIGLGRAPAVPLPSSFVAAAGSHARALGGVPGAALAIRSGAAAEARTVAARIAGELGWRPVFVEVDHVEHLGPLVALRGLLPVFCFDLAPGDRKLLPAVPGYDGPVLVVCGQDGHVERVEGRMLSWTLPVPDPDERRALWSDALGDGALTGRLAATHRHPAGRIADLARLARHHAHMRGRERPVEADVAAAAWASEGADLGALAQPLSEPIGDEALVFADPLRAELETLRLRCERRDGLVAGLGPSSAARYRPGIKALFVGPSGTGKTLGACWLATRLATPIYRVDLASVTSKYIGETEKNLARLFARAEHADVVLLFDEADAMFGKRTDVKEANDRFANAQTNYLLQRIESFDGVAILTSNSKSRFDPAFLRRLDAILEFAPPSPEERRRLWLSHLGEAHRLSPREVNRLAAACELPGGHIRNVVLLAAALAGAERRAIVWDDLVRGLEGEYKKLGRTVPSDLRGRG